MLHRELVESLKTDAAGAQGLYVRRLTAYIDQCLTGGQVGVSSSDTMAASRAACT